MPNPYVAILPFLKAAGAATAKGAGAAAKGAASGLGKMGGGQTYQDLYGMGSVTFPGGGGPMEGIAALLASLPKGQSPQQQTRQAQPQQPIQPFGMGDYNPIPIPQPPRYMLGQGRYGQNQLL